MSADGQGEGAGSDLGRRIQVAATICGREALKGDHLNGMQVYGGGTACVEHSANMHSLEMYINII